MGLGQNRQGWAQSRGHYKPYGKALQKRHGAFAQVRV
jgi:hypothetical protein